MPLSLDPSKLLSLHAVTREVSQLCLRQLKAHVDALSPLFRPRRVLGDHMEGIGKEGVAGSDKNMAELQELFAKVALKPFDLRPELKAPLESVATQFQLHDWEYMHATQTPQGWQQIRVTTPLTWVLTFTSPYTASTLADVVAGNAARDTDAVRAYVLRACLMHEQLRKVPALTDLLTGLRYKLEIRKSPQLGELPLVTISAPFKTMRPADDLLAMAAGLTGGASFSEVLDVDSVREHSDPLRDATLAILKQHKVEL